MNIVAGNALPVPGIVSEAALVIDPDRNDAFAEVDKAWAKKGFRFAVGNPKGGYSGVWTTFARDSGMYFSVRSLLGALKVSLHQSRRCRVAFTDVYARELVQKSVLDPAEDRAFVKWTRPPSPEDGAVLVASIIIPGAYLNISQPSGSKDKPLVIFEVTGAEAAAEFDIFYSRTKPEILEENFLKIGKPICYWTFSDGETAHLVARERDFDHRWLPTSDQFDKASRRLLDPEAIKAGMSNLNAVFFNEPSDTQPLQIVEVGGLRLVPKK